MYVLSETRFSIGYQFSMEKWKKVHCTTGTSILPVRKGIRVCRFRSKIFYRRRKRLEEVAWRDGGGTHFFGRVHPRVQLPYRSQPPSSVKLSKPVSRVSQSRVKQLSAFAPSRPWREKRQVGTSQIETYRPCKSTEGDGRAFSFKADRTTLYLPGAFEWKRPSATLFFSASLRSRPEMRLNISYNNESTDDRF